MIARSDREYNRRKDFFCAGREFFPERCFFTDVIPETLPALLAERAKIAGPALLASGRMAPRTGCAIFASSGTTQAPKFVLHDQRTVLAHSFDIARSFGLGEDAVMLLAPPLCGVFGFCSAMAAMAEALLN